MTVVEQKSKRPKKIIQAMRRPLKARVTVHDKTQVQVDFRFAFSKEKSKDPGEIPPEFREYLIDVYILFPPQLHVDRHDYDKEDFYHDLGEFLRLREPDLSFKRILGLRGAPGVSPLSDLRQRVEDKLQIGPSELSSLANDCKIFGCTFTLYFQKRLGRKREKIERLAIHNQTADTDTKALKATLSETRELATKAHAILEEWRALLALTADAKLDETTPLLEEMRAADEYVTYTFVDGLAALIKAVQDLPSTLGKSDRETYHCLFKLKALLRLESWRARKRSYAVISATSGRRERERMLYRRRTLKRHINSVLYIEAMEIRPGFVRRNLGAMLAAGLAAAWAFFASYMIWSYTKFSGFDQWGSLIGANGLMTITAFVLAYVLKDRIKDIGKQSLSLSIFSNRYDAKERLYFCEESGTSGKVGTVWKGLRFLSTEQLPESLRDLYLRFRRDVVFEIPSKEFLLQFSKRIRLSSKSFHKFPSQATALQYIFRLNLDRFLPKLDDPVEHAVTIGRDGTVSDVELPKVYYLDLLFAYRAKGSNKPSVKEYARLVLTKEGLKRVEYLKPPTSN